MKSNPKVVLIVEDDPRLADVLQDGLSDAGFKVLVARDGEAGLKTALEQQPDMILLDLLLPKKEGIVVLQELRAHPKGKDIPVTVLTNYGETDNVNAALRYGAHNFFVKSNWDIDKVIQEVVATLS